MRLDDYDDSGLAELAGKIRDERERRKTVAQAKLEQDLSARAEIIAQFLCKEGGALIDALAPKHNPSRYGRHCSDDNPYGYDRPKYDHKEYGCRRCVLLAIARKEMLPSEVIGAFEGCNNTF